MKNTDSIISTYRLARYALAAGTGLTAWITWRNFAEGYFGPGIVAAMTTIVLSVVTLLVFDGVAFSSLESAVKHIFSQERMPTRSALFYVLAIGMFAYAGSMIFSLRAVPVLADAAVEDKSDVYQDMQAAKAQGDASRAALLKEANREIARAERALADAKAAQRNAQADGVKAQGGEFARLWLSGNAWVRTAPAFKRQRAAVARYEAEAAQAVKDAADALKRAQEAKAALLTRQDAETAQIIAAGSAAVQAWQGRLMNSQVVIFYLTIFSGLLSVLLLLNLGSLRAIPDTKDLIDVLRESFDLGMDAMIYAFSGANNWARSKTRLGVVSGGQSVHMKGEQVAVSGVQVVPPKAEQTEEHRSGEQGEQMRLIRSTGGTKKPPKPRNYGGTNARELKNLRRAISMYKQRAIEGTLSEKGARTLARMERDYEAKKRVK